MAEKKQTRSDAEVDEAARVGVAGVSQPYTTRPTTQLDLERRLAREEAGLGPPSALNAEPDEDTAGLARDFRVEDNDTSGYFGVAPEYQNYANETERPLVAEEGPEAAAEERLAEAASAEVPSTEAPEPEAETRTTAGAYTGDGAGVVVAGEASTGATE